MIRTHDLPITAVNKRHIGDDVWYVSIIVDGDGVQASTSFNVWGEDNVPYRGDEVEVKQDTETGEAWIVWWVEWY